ncbi:MAG TPA: hypothetical protein PK772_05560 [Chitinophagaceae bacterium]|nr:hypothetical protein [Chitinophagaceae bacterium]
MSKPFIHAQSSAKKFGGIVEDYLDIHNFLDSSKAVIPDNRHRALTHNSWFISTVLEKVFGVTITNAEGKAISVRDIAEQHVLEDFGGKFIPSAQDYLQEIEYKEWMNGQGFPSSRTKVEQQKNKLFIPFDKD